MKRKIAVMLIITCTLLMNGCTDSTASVSTPDEISDGESIISYNDNKESDDFQSFQQYVTTNDDGDIRNINISSSNINTYKNICVGDDITKVEDLFSYEYEMSDTIYSVLFDGTKEINPTEEDKGDSWIWINYIYENNKITSISIYDVKYGREMQ